MTTPAGTRDGLPGNGTARLTAARLAAALGQPAPTPNQARVVEAPLAPLLVVAGAGSGKTATMVNRVVYLIATGQVAPAQVLGLTFTRKAAAELAQRVRTALATLRGLGLAPPASADGEAEVSTYHAYAGRLFRDHALRAGREPASRLITEAVRWQLVTDLVRDYDGPMDAVVAAVSTVVGQVRRLSAEMAEHLVEPDDVRRLSGDVLHRLDRQPAGGRGSTRTGWTRTAVSEVRAATLARLAILPIVDAFAEHKRAHDLVDFGDQVALVARIAREHPDVARAERERFRVVLLDEYQDTGYAQETLLASLFGGGHPVTAVGDPCQSIYGWRGASAGSLERFGRVFPHADGTPASRVELLTSFRNAGRILAVANTVSAPLREASGVGELRAPDQAADAGRLVAALHLTEVDEAGWLAERLAGFGAGGVAWSQMAVLCRKRRQFEPIRAALADAGVPVEVVGLGGLLTVPPVADVRATLQVLVDTTAGAALLRLLTGPRWRIGPRDLVALGRRARSLREDDPALPAGGDGEGGVDAVAAAVAQADEVSTGSIVEALDDLGDPARYSAEGLRRLRALQAELRALRERASQPLADLVLDVIATLGLDVEVASQPDVDPAVGRSHLDAFVDAAADFAGQDEADTSLPAFLAYLRAAEDEEHGLELGQVSEADSVKLMTVHAAKGLEWDVVAVPGLASGDRSGIFPAPPTRAGAWATCADVLPYPLRGDRDDLPQLAFDRKDGLAEFREEERQRQLREERRLAYVAVTRARQVLLASGYVWSATGSSPLDASEYLAVVRAAAAEHGEVDAWVTDPGPANPLLDQREPVPWPVPADEERLAGVREAAEWVERLRGAGPAQRPPSVSAAAGGDPASRDARWDAEIEVLLAERAADVERSRQVSVQLPDVVSVSALVALRSDANGFAASLARPLPRRPDPLARRGTAFHAWLEQRFGQQRLIDPDEMPGSADETAVPDADLEELKVAFEAGRWAARTPVEVEVPFDMPLAGVVVRGRMDAVFADDDGGFTVVDWKTGGRPTAEALSVRAVQLAAYRLAWSALAGVPLDRVRAAFVYVRSDETVAPADLYDRARLEALVTGTPPPASTVPPTPLPASTA